jgi:hypothetical protein
VTTLSQSQLGGPGRNQKVDPTPFEMELGMAAVQSNIVHVFLDEMRAIKRPRSFEDIMAALIRRWKMAK